MPRVNKYTNIATATTTQVQSRAGILSRIVMNEDVVSSVVTLYDNTSVGAGAADPNGIVESVTPAAGPNESLTLDGALVSAGTATLGYGRKVTVVTAADEVGKTFTITGTGNGGDVLTEVITATAGPTTDTGTENFLTVTAVVVSANTVGAITIGAAVQSGTLIGTITAPATLLANGYSRKFDVGLRFGLTIVTSEATDITVAHDENSS